MSHNQSHLSVRLHFGSSLEDLLDTLPALSSTTTLACVATAFISIFKVHSGASDGCANKIIFRFNEFIPRLLRN